MPKTANAIKTLLGCAFLGACVGFLLCGGWRMFSDYAGWHYEITMHANDVEQTMAFLNWCASGPAWGIVIGAIAGAVLAKKTRSHNTEKS